MANTSDRLLVTPDALKSQAETVRTNLQAMENRFQELRDAVMQTGSFWTGEAGDRHRERYTSRLDWVDEVLLRYREQVTDLEKMAGVYEEAEAKAVNAADELPVSDL